MMKKWLSLALTLFFTALISQPALADYQRVLSTPARIVVILVACPEGEPECSHVTYIGVNRASGDVTQLKGSDWVRQCPGHNAPCQHVGFKFASKEGDYYVSDDGSLIVLSSSGELLASERGKWIDIAAGQLGVQRVGYEPRVVQLRGTVTIETKFGHPNYGENPDSDQREIVPTLHLDQPIDVIGTGEHLDPEGETKREVTDIQIAMPDAATITPGCKLVTGSLMPGVTGHHYTPVVMNVTSVIASDHCAPQ